MASESRGVNAKRRKARRASTAKPSVSASRCASGPARPPPEIAASRASSAGLNGNTDETPVDHREQRLVDGPGRHEREEGDRQRQGEGQQRGGLHLARERADRRAHRREAEPARRPAASSHAGARAQSRPVSAARPHSISRQTASEHSAASSTFSESSAVRDTSPRTSRPKACCSRSSASRPAASSSATNISETVTATATKNELSEEVAPLTLVCLTSTGEPIVARIGLETSRLSAARRAKRATCGERHALRGVLRERCGRPPR